MKYLLALLLLTAVAQAQTYFKVATEAPGTTATLPAGTVFRFGLEGCGWSSTLTQKASAALPVYWPSGQMGISPDPCPGKWKELDVAETSAAQSITVSINGKSSVVTIPALPVVVPPPPASTTYLYNCTGQITGTITVDATGKATLTASTITLTQPCNGVKQQ